MRLEALSRCPGLSDPAEVAARCNALCFSMTTPLGMTNALGEYVRLLLALRMDERIEVAPLRRLLSPLADDKLRVAVRHDVDHDLPAAAQMCEVEQAVGVRASYYLHHASAYYYGEFDQAGVFHRHEARPRSIAASSRAGPRSACTPTRWPSFNAASTASRPCGPNWPGFAVKA